MMYPFYDDMGFSKVEIASISKVFGVVATIVGALIGGAVVSRLGILKSLLFCGILQGFLFIVDSQREEIRAFARLLARRRSDEDSGIPISYQYSAIRLLGHFTSLNDQWTTGQFHFKCFEQFLFLLSKCFFIRLFII